MLKKTGLFALLVLFMFLSLGRMFGDEVPQNSFAKYLPENSFMFVELSNLAATLERMDGLALSKFINDPEMKLFFDELFKNLDKDGEGKDVKDKIDFYFNRAKDLFKGRFCFAVPAINPSNKEIRLLLAAEMAEGMSGEVVKYFAEIRDELLNTVNEDDVVITEETIAGVKVTVMKKNEAKPDKESVCYTVTDKVAVLTVGKKTIESFLSNMKTAPEKSLAATTEFKKIYGGIHAGDVFWFADGKQLISMMEPQMRLAAQMMPALGKLLEFSKSMAGKMGAGITIKGDKFIDEMLTLVNNPNLETYKAMKDITLQYKTAALMPKKCFIYAVAGIPLDAVYKDIMAYMPDGLPESVRNFEDQTFLSIKDDIIPAFGSEIGMYLSMETMLPDFLLAFELKDANVISKMLEGLKAIIPMPLNEYTYRDHKLYTFSTPIPGMQFAAAVHNNFLLLGTMRAAQEAIARGEENFTQSPLFKDAMTLTMQTKAQSLVIVDVQGIFGYLYDSFLPYLQNFLMQMADFDMTTVPSREAFVDHFIPIVALGALKNGNSFMYSEGLMSLSSFQLLSLFINIAQSMAMQAQLPADDEAAEPEDMF